MVKLKQAFFFLIVAGFGSLGFPLAHAKVLTSADGKAPFIFTTMTHLEENFTDDVEEELFLYHVETLRWAMALFDEYGVKMTVEASRPFARANTNWGVNILNEILSRGHGVGTHVGEIGGDLPKVGTAACTRTIREVKSLVDGLVGAANNVVVSGVLGRDDWVEASYNAGFSAIDAIVGFGYLSMPLAARPSGWTDAAIISTYYHESAPTDFTDRIYPFKLQNADDFVADGNGIILISPGDLGELASLHEGRSVCGSSCTLDGNDSQVVYDAIDRVVSIRNSITATQKNADTKQADVTTTFAERFGLTERGRVMKLNVHIPMDTLVPAHEKALRVFLAGLKTYADNGTLVFGTQKDVVDTYDAW